MQIHKYDANFNEIATNNIYRTLATNHGYLGSNPEMAEFPDGLLLGISGEEE